MRRIILSLAVLSVLCPSWGSEKAVTAAPSHTKGSQIVVYYFHGTARCPTCRKMETYARETLQKDFSKELAQGTIQWKVLNFDEAANKHYINDFTLYASSLVLVEEVGGKTIRYKNLDQIYQSAGSQSTFSQYLRGELQSFLKAS